MFKKLSNVKIIILSFVFLSLSTFYLADYVQVNAERNSDTTSSTTETSQISDEEIEKNISYRKNFGLMTDKETVKKIIAENQGNGSKEIYGVTLTDEELEELKARDMVIEEAKKVRSVLQTDHPDIYGGMYMDQKNGGIMYVYIVDLEKNRDFVNKLFSNFNYKERLQIINAKNSYDQLEKIKEDVIKFAEENGLNIKYVGPSEKDNRVVVGISQEDQNAINLIQSQFPPERVEIHKLPSNF